ncbi:response regulator [Spirochaeta africana]|uniref:response regulator n=1 Tax=Spirochaeta africana TaxID=46355 RepID=UPI00145D7DB6|nr:response regulator [Spirochaeta africana]
MSRRTLAHFTRRLLPDCRIVTASDGEAARSCWLQHRPQVSMLDLNMPHLDGCDLVSWLRAYEQQHQLPPHHNITTLCIAITGYSAAHVGQQCRQAGFDGFLEKPVGLEDLKAALHFLQRQTTNRNPT